MVFAENNLRINTTHDDGALCRENAKLKFFLVVHELKFFQSMLEAALNACSSL